MSAFTPPKERSCDGKRRYGSHRQAKRAAKLNREHVFAYACTYCPWWHVGHRPKHLFAEPERTA